MADTALAGWGELIPLLAFIILGWLANRAKQKKEEELLGKPGSPKPPGQVGPPAGIPAPARRDAGRQAPHTFEDGEDVEDWTGEDWDGEHSERWDDRKSGEVRSETPRPAEDRVERLRPVPAPPSRPPEAQRQVPAERGAEKPPLIPDKAREKAAEVGKDLLSQLAKELGLELPKPRPAPKPAPAPQPQAKAPRTGEGPAPKAPAHAHVPRSQGVSSDEVRARAAEAGRSQARPASIPSLAPVAAPIAKTLISAAEIANGEAMRKAFVLKTILDKPLSLKPRGLLPE